MSFGSILLLSVGVAMDATAVAAARGVAARALRPRHFVLVAAFFGGSQALMPLLGGLLGASIGPLVSAWDHWIAFALLVGIGGKMLWEARRNEASDAGSAPSGAKEGADEEAKEDVTATPASADPFDLRVLAVLAVATSIDALAVGVTLPLVGAPIAASVAAMRTMTALLAMLGLGLGRRLGALLGRRLDVLGGCVLVGLGVRILVEHLASA